jgi:hypothetical protein
LKGRVEHVRTGAAAQFDSLPVLLEFMAEMLAGVPRGGERA